MRQPNAHEATPHGGLQSRVRRIAALGAVLGVVAVILSGCVAVPVGGGYGYGYDHPHHRYGHAHPYPDRHYQG